MTSVTLQHEHNVRASSEYVPLSALPLHPPVAVPVRLIAYYLPQFHETSENNQWWGNGFTEWTNVTKSLPRYIGHYQPRLPADLGFYDLSKADAIRRQADLANRAGIYGFCIHNYWFSGKTVLETPLNIILENKDINIRFCLNWANETWSRRWDGWDQSPDVLIKQEYNPGEDLAYARYVARFLGDERYIRINNRPVLMIYRPNHLPDGRATVERWREFFVRSGFGNPYLLMPQAYNIEIDPGIYGFDAVAGFPPHKGGFESPNIALWLKILDGRFRGRVAWYDDVAKAALSNFKTDYKLFPGVCPLWDNEPRKANQSFSIAGSTPEKYQAWLCSAGLQVCNAYEAEERIVFINAWNEWAEGAYLEPDRHYGASYLLATLKAIEQLSSGGDVLSVPPKSYSSFDVPTPSAVNLVRNVPRKLLSRILSPRY